jgi:hypothetical protein
MTSLHRSAIGHRVLGLAALTVALAASVPATAAMIQIQFTGLDLAYDGTQITDGGVGEATDPLSSIVVSLDGTQVAGSPFSSGVAIDLVIPGVSNIPASGGVVESAAGGQLRLTLPSGGFLNLALDRVTVNYLNLGRVQFAFGATVAGIDGQSLPADLELGAPATLSFSATVGQELTGNNRVTSFRATGSGEIMGDRIPEPAAGIVLLVALGVTTGIVRYRFG